MGDRKYVNSTGRSTGLRRRKAGASRPASMEETLCSTTCESSSADQSIQVVSQAVSQAVPLSNNREQQKTEIKDTTHQSCNKSCSDSENTVKPNCYECVHRGSVPGSAHSRCLHPSVKDTVEDPLMSILGMMGSKRLGAGDVDLQNEYIGKPINVVGDEYGIRSGWFHWPINFDPTWLESCDGFEPKE